MRNLIYLGALLLASTAAHAQFGPNWSTATPPENGACFYEKPEFKGQYFCLDVDGNWYELNSTFLRKISSVRVIGKAAVRAFSEPHFQGDSVLITDRTPDLHKVAATQAETTPAATKKNWNDRIASLQVVAQPDRQIVRRRPDRPEKGACFFTDPEYGGRELCVPVGTAMARLPDGFERKVSSLRPMGEVELVLYTKRDFQGVKTVVRSRVRDMRELTQDAADFYNWNKKVRSAIVRPLGTEAARFKPPAEVGRRQ